MAKKDTTSFSVSGTLKTAMSSKGILGIPDVNQTYYNGASETHLLIADMSDGTHRCVIKNTNGVDFDFHTISDPAYVRMFTVRELQIIIGNYPGVAFSDFVQQGANYTHTITHNGVNRTGQSQNIADAHALAFIAVLNAS
jgi:hypothetical protein